MVFKFAMPIAHKTTGQYEEFNNKIMRGRPFRQYLPITLSDDGNYARGLELFIDSSENLSAVYAFASGDIRWDDVNNALILNIDPELQKVRRQENVTSTLLKLPMIESFPTRVIYENLDRTSVRSALEDLLYQTYQASNTTSNQLRWHPLMRIRLTLPGRPTIRTYLNNNEPIENPIHQIISNFLSASPTQFPAQMTILTGDKIGAAAGYLETDPLPENSVFNLGNFENANRAKRLTLRMQDRCELEVDPVYYLFYFTRQVVNQMSIANATHIVESLTSIAERNASGPEEGSHLVDLIHPLSDEHVCPELHFLDPPPARAQVQGKTRIFIGEKVENYHGYPYSSPVSQFEWRYHSNQFEIRPRVDRPPPTPSVEPNNRDLSQFTAIYYQYVEFINQICEYLQVPAELIWGKLGAESRTVDGTIIRLEPLKLFHRNFIQNQVQAGALRSGIEEDYDAATTVGGAVTSIQHQAGGDSAVQVTFPAGTSARANYYRGRTLLIKRGANREEWRIRSNTAIQNQTSDISVSNKFQSEFTETFYQGVNTNSFYPIQGALSRIQTVETRARTTIQNKGLLKSFRVIATTNSLDGVSIFTVFKNGSPTDLVVSLSAGNREGIDTTHSIEVEPNDRISIQVNCSGTQGVLTGLSLNLDQVPRMENNITAWALTGNRIALHVPSPWNPSQSVQNNPDPNTSNLTWGDIADLLDAADLNNLRNTCIWISPGLAQTLISTAYDIQNWLTDRMPQIYDLLELDPPPANLGRYLSHWLINPKISLLLGTAYIRMLYNQYRTYFDLPLVGSSYNSGSLKLPGVTNTFWGLLFYNDTYVPSAATFFNAFVPFELSSTSVLRGPTLFLPISDVGDLVSPTGAIGETN